jgi:DNA-directed RNA polymerase subunit beta
LESGMPESFNVLVKEMMALGLEVSLIEEDPKKRAKRK